MSEKDPSVMLAHMHHAARRALISRDCPAFLQAHESLPVSEMRGMRNRIAHGYFFLDLDVVWQTVSEQVPDLFARLTKILNDGKTHGQS